MVKKSRQREPHGDPVAAASASVLDAQVENLKRLFPEVVSEGRVDWEKLRATLGEIVDDRPERYSFTWAGKRDAIRLLQTPSRATLAPAPDESVNFDGTNNVFVEGDNLEVLKLLYKAYAGRIKLIYIDPPYNTGNDFVYPDNFADPLDTYLQLTGQKDAEGNLLTSNPETSGRYHSNWLTMMYPRLFLARQLLREDGVIFVSIDDNEVHNLRMLMNEVFGEENFVADVVWQHSIQPKGYLGKFSVHHNWILCYQKSETFTLESLQRTEEHNKNYSNPDNDPRGPWRAGDVRNALYRPNLIFDITTPSGKVIKPPPNGWRWSKETIAAKMKAGEVIFSRDEARIIRKIHLCDVQGRVPETIWFGKEVGTTRDAVQQLKDLFDGSTPFDTPKPSGLVRRMLHIATEADGGNCVLDFFAGSCTTAQAVLELNREDDGNRRFIMVQLPEPLDKPQKLGKGVTLKTVADIGKERIRRVIRRLEHEQQGKLDLADRDAPEDLGFKVFKLRESHYRRWAGVEEREGESYARTMELFDEALLLGWEPTDVIYEVAIKEGYGLTSRLEKLKKPTTNAVYQVTDSDRGQSFLICLDDELEKATLDALKLRKEQLLICRDVALTDTLAANLALQCRLKTI